MVGCRTRNRETSWAAERLPPPCAKKSSSSALTGLPRTAYQSAPSAAAVPLSASGEEDVGSAPATGHGNASRSTFPEVLVGRVSTTARVGTSAAGTDVRRVAAASLGSKVGEATT